MPTIQKRKDFDRMPLDPPFGNGIRLRYIGLDGVIAYGSLATAIRSVEGHKGDGKLIVEDDGGKFFDQTSDGYSVVELDDGQTVSVLADSADSWEILD